MRLLIDREGLEWDQAWQISTASTGYTNHTILPEALERWPVPMFERLLPRHLQIIYEINARFLRDVARRYPFDTGRLRRMSIIEEGEPKYVRMAHLAIVGSCSVNGVSALHTDLLRTRVLRDFAEYWPAQVQQQDERDHAAALAVEGQSAACSIDYRSDRGPMDHRSR